MKRLGIEWRYGTKSKGPSIFPTEYSGIIGRLINAMGVAKPEGRQNGRQEVTKPVYRNNSLPHYYWDIVEAEPSDKHEQEQKVSLLKTICNIHWMDRLSIRKQGIYLRLNNFLDEESAKSYAVELIDFLNYTHRARGGKGIFAPDQIRIDSQTNRNRTIYRASIRIEPNQFYRIMGDHQALEVQISYRR